MPNTTHTLRPELSKMLGVAALYCLLSWVTHSLLPTFGPSGCFFLSSGLALAALLAGGRYYFWAVWLGGILANMLVNNGVWPSFLFGFTSAAASLINARLILRNDLFDIGLLSLRSILKFYVFGGLMGSSVYAILNVAALLVVGVANGDNYIELFQDCIMINMLGIILITPIIFSILNTVAGPILRLNRKTLAESVLFFGLVGLLGANIFLNFMQELIPKHLHDVLRAYLMFIFIIWAALRLGMAGVSIVALLVAILAIAGVNQNLGFFASDYGYLHMGSYWLYITILTLTGTLLSAYLEENKLLCRLLEESNSGTKSALDELNQQKYVLDKHALVAVTDVEGNITYCNEKLCEIIGYSGGELIGKNHRIMSSGVHSKEFWLDLYSTLERGEVWQGEVCNKSKNGQIIWLATTIAPFFENGILKKYIAVRSDITHRKLAEDAANYANSAKSEFLANMSHEIRTPMNGVVGMLDIIKQTPLSSVQHRMINTVYDSSLMLLQIINDVLDFSKIEAGKLGVEIISTHLLGVAEEVTKLMIAIANKKSIQLFVFVSPKLPCWIASDPVRLRQILYNLLGNALKFTTSDNNRMGRVTLCIEPCSLADGRPGVALCVSDNGIGMSEETQSNLFQPFTQADGTIARKYGGSGLGLSIVQRLTTIMSGQTLVRSTQGVGTDFTVIFPLQEMAPQRMSLFEPNLDGIHVLCVSKDAMIIKIVSAYCMELGAQVTVVADMATAYQQPPLSQPLPSSTSLVVLHDGVDCNELDLPAGIGIIRLISLNESSSTSGISINASPIFHSELIQCVSIAGTKLDLVYYPGQLKNNRLRKTVIAPTVEQAVATNRLILLAEDNDTNREVMLEQLSLLGYTAEFAEDGEVALKMWHSGRYALLLTDCHMPNMDGFDLTTAIRQAEQEGTHMPIIAVTANAMQGEAARCKARGMDDYLSKPLRLEELDSVLLKWLPNEENKNTWCEDVEAVVTGHATDAIEVMMDKFENQDETLEHVSSDPFAIWDDTTLPRLLGDNPAMIRRLLVKFLPSAQAQVATIIAAAATSEIGILSDAAHKLKSGARTVGAMHLGELCHEMETAVRAGDKRVYRALVEQLSGVFAATEEAIKESLV